MSEDILSSAMELSVAPEEKVEVKEEANAKPVTETQQENTLETLESLAEKTEDAVPLKKYMAEKNAKRESDKKVKELQSELEKLRNSPISSTEVKLDVKSLSDKHGIDEEVLKDILNASYNMSKDKIREELEKEINPKLAEFEGMKKEKQVKQFEETFNGHLSETLKEMPEYKDLIDPEDIKTWIRSGQYSKLTLPQLIEQKYSKFVQGKKTIESGYTPSRETESVDMKNLSDADYAKLDSDPEFKKKWAESLPDRLRSIL